MNVDSLLVVAIVGLVFDGLVQGATPTLRTGRGSGRLGGPMRTDSQMPNSRIEYIRRAENETEHLSRSETVLLEHSCLLIADDTREILLSNGCDEGSCTLGPLRLKMTNMYFCRLSGYQWRDGDGFTGVLSSACKIEKDSEPILNVDCPEDQECSLGPLTVRLDYKDAFAYFCLPKGENGTQTDLTGTNLRVSTTCWETAGIERSWPNDDDNKAKRSSKKKHRNEKKKRKKEQRRRNAQSNEKQNIQKQNGKKRTRNMEKEPTDSEGESQRMRKKEKKQRQKEKNNKAGSKESTKELKEIRKAKKKKVPTATLR